MKKGLILIVCFVSILAMMTGCGASKEENGYKDGAYTGIAEGVHGDIELSVVIDGGKITEINVIEQGETSGVSEVAFAEVPSAIIDAQTTAVDTVTGATVSSQAIIDAVNKALEQAK